MRIQRQIIAFALLVLCSCNSYMQDGKETPILPVKVVHNLCTLSVETLTHELTVLRLEYATGVSSANSTDGVLDLPNLGPGTMWINRTEEGKQHFEVTVLTAEGLSGSCSVDYSVPEAGAIAAPTCSIQKASVYSGSDIGARAKPALRFHLVLEGAVTSASFKGRNLALPPSVDPAAPLEMDLSVDAQESGMYLPEVVVQGPGGSASCSKMYQPPSCVIRAQRITANSAELVLNPSADTKAASIQNAALDLSAWSWPYTVVSPYAFVGSDPKTVEGRVTNDDQDSFLCHATFQPLIPPEPGPLKCSIERSTFDYPTVAAAGGRLRYTLSTSGGAIANVSVLPAGREGVGISAQSASTYSLLVPMTQSTTSYSVSIQVRSTDNRVATCSTDVFSPPTCSLELNKKDATEVTLAFTYGPAVRSARVDNLRFGPNENRSLEGQGSGSMVLVSNNRANGRNAPTNAQGGNWVSQASVTNVTGDVGACQVDYALPNGTGGSGPAEAPEPVNVVFSFISKAKNSFTLDPNNLFIQVPNERAPDGTPLRSWGPAENLQILMVFGNGVEKILSEEDLPSFLRDKDRAFLRSIKTGYFKGLLLGKACPATTAYNKTVEGVPFAKRPAARTPGMEGLDAYVNRGSLSVTKAVKGSALEVSIDDPQQDEAPKLGRGYYQFAVCAYANPLQTDPATGRRLCPYSIPCP